MVYVLSIRGKQLMPCSEAKARHLLKAGKAKCVKREPFTIQLKFKCENKTQPITLGIDAGSKQVGVSASTDKAELFAAELILRNDIVELLAIRKELRIKRRIRKIRHRQCRFLNRKHNMGEEWTTPSIKNKIDAHLKIIKNVTSILPITKIIIETASFDMQKMEDPNLSGTKYKEGQQLGFWNVREYVLWRDNHTCQHCKGKSGNKILNVHHIESRKTGGNAPNNLITLCETCHKKLHKGKIKLKIKRGQSFRDAAFMGIMRKTLLNRLKKIYNISGIEIQNTYGYLTKNKRIENNIPKTHCSDAFCIANNLNAKRLPYLFLIKQVRRHNRQIYKQNQLKNGIWKRNQAPFCVKGFRLFDKVKYNNEIGFIFARRTKGYFDIRKLDGSKINPSVGYKKLTLISKRKTFLIEKICNESLYDVPKPETMRKIPW